MLPRNAPSASWGRAPNSHSTRMPNKQHRSRHVVSFRTDSHVVVPTDYYSLLQVHPTSSREAVRQKYEARIAHPPVSMYSTEVLFSRAVLLKLAADSLTDQGMRLAYERKLGHGLHELKVSQADLPGALVLLQEAGDADAVVELAGGWLERNAAAPDSGDVAVCLALAHCDRASVALQANPPTMLHACSELESARSVLIEHRVAQQLQEQVTQALQDLAPEHALGLVSLPLDPQHAQQRDCGKQLLAAALAKRIERQAQGLERSSGYHHRHHDMDEEEEEAEVGRRHDEVLQAARHQLTAAEQIALGLPLCQSREAAAILTHQPGLVYDTALALIAEGYRNGWAHNIHLADQLLRRIEQVAGGTHAAGGTRKPAHKQPVQGTKATGWTHGTAAHCGDQLSVERAVCAVMLGDTAAAVAVLGLPDERDAAAAGEDADPDVVAFVMEHAPPGGRDIAPGLQALAERWLTHVAMPSSRAALTPLRSTERDSEVAAGAQTASTPLGASLTSWHGDGRVAAYIKVWHVARFAGILLGAVHSLICTWTAVTQLLQGSASQRSSSSSLPASEAKTGDSGPDGSIEAAAAATTAAAAAFVGSLAAGRNGSKGTSNRQVKGTRAVWSSMQQDQDGGAKRQSSAAAGPVAAQMVATEGRALSASAAVAAAAVATEINELAAASYDLPYDAATLAELAEPAATSETDMQGALRALEAEMWDSTHIAVHVPIAWRDMVARAAVLGLLLAAVVMAVNMLQRRRLVALQRPVMARVQVAKSS